MQLDLDVPERLVRKLKALNILQGGNYAANFESYIAAMLETTIDHMIMEALNTEAVALPQPHIEKPAKKAPPQPAAPVFSYQDETGLSEGLGDEDPSDDNGTSDEMAFVPKASATVRQDFDDDLDHDMDIDDPGSEAKAEAAELPPSVDADDAFARMLGLPSPAHDYSNSDTRGSRRKRNIKLKARVTPATHI